MPLEFDEFPVVERIAQKIVCRVATVRLAECFMVELVRVVRPGRLGVGSPQHGNAVVEQLDAEVNEEASVPGNPPIIAYDQPFTVALYVLQSDSDETPLDQLINLFRAEVEKALTLNSDPNWQNFDGLAINAAFGKPTLFGTNDGQFAGITLKLTVTYRTPLGDPYTAVG